MLRMSMALAFSVLLAGPSAALAQAVTTTSATIDSVKVTGSRGAPTNTATPIDTQGSLLKKLQSARPALPTLNSPQSGDTAG